MTRKPSRATVLRAVFKGYGIKAVDWSVTGRGPIGIRIHNQDVRLSAVRAILAEHDLFDGADVYYSGEAVAKLVEKYRSAIERAKYWVDVESPAILQPIDGTDYMLARAAVGSEYGLWSSHGFLRSDSDPLTFAVDIGSGAS